MWIEPWRPFRLKVFVQEYVKVERVEHCEHEINELKVRAWPDEDILGFALDIK